MASTREATSTSPSNSTGSNRGDDRYDETFFGLSADVSEVLGTEGVDFVDVDTLSPSLMASVFDGGVFLLGERERVARAVDQLATKRGDERSPASGSTSTSDASTSTSHEPPRSVVDRLVFAGPTPNRMVVLPFDMDDTTVLRRRPVACGPRIARGGDRGGRSDLRVLGERIARGQAEDLAARLPENLGAVLTAAENEAAAEFPPEEFVERVREYEREQKASLDVTASGLHVQAVLESLAASVDGDVWHDVRTRLPTEYDRLFQAG